MCKVSMDYGRVYLNNFLTIKINLNLIQHIKSVIIKDIILKVSLKNINSKKSYKRLNLAFYSLYRPVHYNQLIIQIQQSVLLM